MNSKHAPFYVPNVVINRTSTHSVNGTVGVISVDGVAICLTLERFDYMNYAFVSCIPAGQYLVTKYENTDKRPEAWRINGVEGRSDILMHIANTSSQLLGCIALGTYIGELIGEFAILGSGNAFEKFNGALGDAKEFKLTINNNF